MFLKDTIDLMNSDNYQDRFKAEYYQLEERRRKLEDMLKKWDCEELNFTPTCPRYLYDKQINAMTEYLEVLKERSILEGVDIGLEV